MAALAVLALIGLSLAGGTGSSASADPKVKIDICHDTGSAHNPFVVNSPDNSGDVNGHDGHPGDIIPPFTRDDGLPYPGKNWTPANQEIYANGCNAVSPDLRMVKTGSGDATTGTSGSYTLSVSNIGTKTAAGPLTVTDTMPAGVVATAASGGAEWSCSVAAAGASITCTRASGLAPKASAAAITVSVNWVTAGSKANTAVVAAVAGDPPGNNSSKYTSKVKAAVVPHTLALTVAKTSDANKDATYGDGETAPYGGGSVTYRGVVTNPTAYDLTVESVTDVVDAAAPVTVVCDPSLVTAPQVSLGATVPAQSTRYCYFTLPGPVAGSSSTDTLTVTAHETADATNKVSGHDGTTVSRAAAPPQPPVQPVLAPDLGIVKAGPSTAVRPGDQVSYTLTVTNTGNGNATGVQVTDSLPAGLTLVSATGTGFTCSGSTTIVCQLAGSLAPGATAVVTVRTTLADTYASTSVTNTASVLPTDATPADNTDTEVTSVTLPVPEDLGISKTGSGSVLAGDVLSWTITVTNVKGTPASGFTVRDVVPSGLTLLTVGGVGWSCATSGDAVTCTYNGAPLLVGDSSSIVLDALVAADYAGSTVSNTAVVDPGGDDPANDSATATTNVLQPSSGGGGGAVIVPTPSPTPSGGGGEALPFTGSYVDLALTLGVMALVAGLVLALAGRRRDSVR